MMQQVFFLNEATTIPFLNHDSGSPMKKSNRSFVIGTIASKINVTSIGAYSPISKLHFSDNLTPLGVTFILLAMVHLIHPSPSSARYYNSQYFSLFSITIFLYSFPSHFLQNQIHSEVDTISKMLNSP